MQILIRDGFEHAASAENGRYLLYRKLTDFLKLEYPYESEA
jgi:hypothetical protein